MSMTPSRAATTFSLTTNLNPANNHDEEQNLYSQSAVRNILGFMDKYERVEQQELLAQMSCHWLLSMEDFKIPIEQPPGVISQSVPLNEDHMLILIPYDPDIPTLDFRELHQIVRELTIGLYVLNQHPCLQLETNFDQSTSCQLPPAYIDTKLGQTMINTDYWLKALWHGSFFTRKKRIKFGERWRAVLDIDANGNSQTRKPILQEFLFAGLADIATDPDYLQIFAKDEENSNASTGLGYGVGMNASFAKSTATMVHEAFSEQSDLTNQQIEDEINHFITFIDDMSMQLTLGVTSVKKYKNIYEFTAGYDINACCKADNKRIDEEVFERLKRIIGPHEQYLRQHFETKVEVKRNLAMLKLVAFLVPLLISLKKRMKIPDLNNLLPVITGEDVHTEREFPPQTLAPDSKSKTFSYSTFAHNVSLKEQNLNSNNTETIEGSNLLINENSKTAYFGLHGGIQFELETCKINQECTE